MKGRGRIVNEKDEWTEKTNGQVYREAKCTVKTSGRGRQVNGEDKIMDEWMGRTSGRGKQMDREDDWTGKTSGQGSKWTGKTSGQGRLVDGEVK